MFRESQLPVYPAVVVSFWQFGGCRFPIGRNRIFQLFELHEVIASAQCGYGGLRTDDPTEFRIPFGHHPVAQMEFFMDGHGTLYADDTPVSQDISHWIEQLTLDNMVEEWQSCFRLALPNVGRDELDAWAQSRMQVFLPASDRYSIWWLGPQVAMNRFTIWGSGWKQEKCVVLFAGSLDSAKEIAEEFQESFGVPALHMLPWPLR